MSVPDTPTRKLLYSVPEAAAMLGHGKSWAYEQIAAGRLRTVTVGSRRMVTAEELERYVAFLVETGGAA